MKRERQASRPLAAAADAAPPSAAAQERVPPRAAEEIERLLATPLAPGLYLVATPIGNLGDITLRALAVLACADAIYCEDTRHSRILTAHFGVAAPLRPYHEHNAEAQRPRVLAELAEGKAVALISDAGTPLISDPGWKLVDEAIAAGHAVVAIPGPSALLTGLVAAGLPTDAFFFAGFLPPREAARRSRIGELAAVPGTLIFYEAPSRLAPALFDLAAVLGPRPAAVARELTKLHEEVVRGPLDELARTYAAAGTRGEITILVGRPEGVAVTDAAIVERLTAALPAMSVRDAAKTVAEALGVAKARVYDLALGLKSGAREE